MIHKGFPGHWKFFISGKTLTELTQTSGDALPYQVHQFAIAPASRELLHQRIEQRFHQMLASGLKQKSGRFCPRRFAYGLAFHSLRGLSPDVVLP